ncbi:hypothetical protein [Paractinoplanes lichenicola]|uniref:Uncharacterized protein n=1 Tax=Paractinoplanes lichenicola TaxID=2802976 RepID=A0ABS1VF71_9ACTN|nr:hypothetical protein [Actinoplanes lichenicola]MBL7253265.1 hypothetical protein [Actinoplanes lichenicola]
MVDVGDLAGNAMPYLSAVAAAYGAGVVERVSEKAEDATADATSRFGGRLLRRLLGSARAKQVREAATELGENPEDESGAVVLRAQVHKALAEDPQLRSDIAALLAEAPAKYNVHITGSQGIQTGDGNTQYNKFDS